MRTSELEKLTSHMHERRLVKKHDCQSFMRGLGTIITEINGVEPVRVEGCAVCGKRLYKLRKGKKSTE